MANNEIHRLEECLSRMPYVLDRQHMASAIKEIKRLQAIVDDPDLITIPRELIESMVSILRTVESGVITVSSRATMIEAARLAALINELSNKGNP